MIEIERSSLEARIIGVLQEVYPITIAELGRELKVSGKVVERSLLKLKKQGIVELESLPDKTYIRLLRQDFRFIGRNPTQRKSLKHTGRKRETEEYDGYMYG